MPKEYIRQEVQENMKVAQKRLLPAVLADIKANGTALSVYMHANGLEPTPQNFLQAIRACESSLQWTVKPVRAPALQTNDEVIRITEEWVRRFAPANVIKSAENIQKITTRCMELQGNILSISGLTEAADELAAAGLIELVPEPKKLTIDEQAAIFQQKEFERIQREQLENSVPFSQRMAEQTKKREAEAIVKKQEDARTTLALLIAGYQCYGLGHVDYNATEQVKKELNTIKVPARDRKGVDGKNIDYVLTTDWIREIIACLVDHPKAGDVYAAYEKVKVKFQQQQEKKPNHHNAW